MLYFNTQFVVHSSLLFRRNSGHSTVDHCHVVLLFEPLIGIWAARHLRNPSTPSLPEPDENRSLRKCLYCKKAQASSTFGVLQPAACTSNRKRSGSISKPLVSRGLFVDLLRTKNDFTVNLCYAVPSDDESSTRRRL